MNGKSDGLIPTVPILFVLLSIIVNQPSQMKNYKKDDISVSQFAENIQNRIEQLERKIRQMRIDDTKPETNTFILFG